MNFFLFSFFFHTVCERRLSIRFDLLSPLLHRITLHFSKEKVNTWTIRSICHFRTGLYLEYDGDSDTFFFIFFSPLHRGHSPFTHMLVQLIVLMLRCLHLVTSFFIIIFISVYFIWWTVFIGMKKKWRWCFCGHQAHLISNLREVELYKISSS